VNRASTDTSNTAHPTKLLGIAQLHLLFTFTTFSLFIHNKSLFSSFHFDPRLAVSSPHGGPQPIMIGFMLYQLIFGPLDSIAQVLMHAQTRKYEYQAGQSSVSSLKVFLKKEQWTDAV
jgi:STE24 endopeptidase